MPVLRLPQLPAAAGKQHWGNLPGAALSLAIAEAASAAKRFTLLLTADSQSAERLEQELSFFAPDLPVLHFPDWETLPYDLFSPHQDIISQRIASLYRLPELAHGVLVVPITTALHRLAPTKFLLGSSLVLDIGQKLDVEQMRTRLEASGYRYVDTVYEHGEFTVRGSLIDLFPMGSKLPYRIDLFDEWSGVSMAATGSNDDSVSGLLELPDRSQRRCRDAERTVVEQRVVDVEEVDVGHKGIAAQNNTARPAGGLQAGPCPLRYFDFSIRYSTAALSSSSVRSAAPPRAGMAFLPLVADLSSASAPVAMRAAQAALSPVFGAPATPASWQALQIVL